MIRLLEFGYSEEGLKFQGFGIPGKGNQDFGTQGFGVSGFGVSGFGVSEFRVSGSSVREVSKRYAGMMLHRSERVRANWGLAAQMFAVGALIKDPDDPNSPM